MSSHQKFDNYSLETIDTSLLVSSNRRISKAENEKLYNASCTIGAFYMAAECFNACHELEDLFRLAYEFMSLSKEEKMNYYRKDSRKFCGYCPDMSKSDDIVDKLSGDLNKCESYSIVGNYDSNVKRLNYQYAFDNFTVSRPKGFSALLGEYYKTMESLAGLLMDGYECSLGLPAGTVQQFTQHPGSFLRVQHYSSNNLPAKTQEVGIPGHTDFQWLTIILQDHNPGLQIEVDDIWYNIKPQDGCFIVLVDDQATLWTNGRLRACPHRVINTSGVERYSLIFLYSVDHEKKVAVVPAHNITKELPNKYFIPGEYIAQRRRETFGDY